MRTASRSLPPTIGSLKYSRSCPGTADRRAPAAGSERTRKACALAPAGNASISADSEHASSLAAVERLKVEHDMYYRTN